MDGADTFNIETMLNENFRKIDENVALIDPLTGKLLPGQENAQSPSDASTTVKGIVMLEDSTSSSSVAKAATAKSVKAAYDLANGKSSFSGSYTDLTNKPTIPSNASQLSITDAGNYYTSPNTEGALQEIGLAFNGARGNLVSSVNTILGA